MDRKSRTHPNTPYIRISSTSTTVTSASVSRYFCSSSASIDVSCHTLTSLFALRYLSTSVVPYYLPSISTTGGTPDPPLPANGYLTIGYGSGGASPHQFFLREDQDVDVGHLKLFLTTKYVDLSFVLQDTPFDTDVQGRHINKPKARAKKIQSPLWDEITVTIVQRAQA